MSNAQALAEFRQGTPISNIVFRLSVGQPPSGLLEEGSAEKPFATFFGETQLHSHDLQVLAVMAIEMEASGTPVLQFERGRVGTFIGSQGELWEQLWEQQQSEPLAKPNADRITLLARKYVAKETFSDEDDARLAIVTERIRQLMPAATIRDFEAVEEVLKLALRIADSNAAIREIIALPAPKKSG